jgi:predicted enzyme related to lactoylglutathione lyase
MTDPTFVILYVADPRASAAFWGDLFGRTPVELADTFAMLPLRDGLMLGLWKADDVAPATTVTGGGAEICLSLADRAAVDTTHADWAGRGLAILQPPSEMDFGYTFPAADPDGHRIRVYRPND